MQVLKELTLDKLINLYEGIVVHDRQQLIEWDAHRRTPIFDIKKRTLAQNKMIFPQVIEQNLKRLEVGCCLYKQFCEHLRCASIFGCATFMYRYQRCYL